MTTHVSLQNDMTLTLAWQAVTFGIKTRCLHGLAPHTVPTLLY